MIAAAGFPLYPLSAHKFCRCLLVGLGRRMTMLSSVSASSFTSCRLAPLTISESGTPVPSTNKLRLVPFFSPICGVVAHRVEREWGFALAAINALPAPSDPFQIIIFGQASLPQLAKKSCRAPLLKMTVNRSSTTKTLGQRLPLTARTQDINDSRENLAWLQGFAPATGKPPIFTPFSPRWTRWYQRLNPGPEFIRHFPRVNFAHFGSLAKRLADVKLI